MLNGAYTFNESPKSHRLTVIIPSLLLRSVFGNNEYATALFPLLCSLATIVLLYRFLIPMDETVAFIGVCLLSLNISQIIYSTVLFPDVTVALFSFLVLWCIYKFRQNKNATLQWIAVCFFVAGFFAKEIILVLLPLIFFLSLKDAFRTGAFEKWRIFYSGLLLFVLALALWSKLVKDDFLFVLHSIETHHNDVFAPTPSGKNLIRRLMAEPAHFLIDHPEFFILFVFALTALVPRVFHTHDVEFWKYAFAFVAAFLWFGSTSPSRFAPFPLVDRMWLVVLVPACILSAFMIKEFSEKRLSAYMVGIPVFLLAGAAAYSFINNFPLRGGFYLVNALLIWVVQRWPRKRRGVALQNAVLLLAPYVFFTFYFILHNRNH